MKVQENSAHFSSRRKQGRFKQLIALLTLLTFICQPMVAAAGGPVADPNAGANKPHIDTTANGTPLVQITNPSAGGVSRNLYQQYNVDPQGVILNNSQSVTLTQQAGYVAANPYLTSGTARVILNEVTGTGASLLRGYTEVAGQKADVVIANPNGITCNGCGFINASRGVLTTGTPVFGGTGSLDAFRVTGGNITIGQDVETGRAGLEARGIDQVDLISRAITVNAGIWANNVNVVTGSNLVNYNDLSAQHIAPDDPTAPAFSLDVSALGGMYANKIRLVGTEAGVGVRSAGNLASTGDFELTSAGDIRISGNATAGGNLTMQTSGAISLLDNGSAGDSSITPNYLYSDGNMTMSAGSLANNILIIADQFILTADRFINDGPAAYLAVKNFDGTANLFVRDILTNSNGATIYSMGDIVIAGSANRDAGGTYLDNTTNVLNQSSTIEAGRDIAVSAGTLTNAKVFTTVEQVISSVPHAEAVAPPSWWPRAYAASVSYTLDTTRTTITRDDPTAWLLAGRNMTLTGVNVDNEYSTIAAGNDLNINITGLLSNIGRSGYEATYAQPGATETVAYNYTYRSCSAGICRNRTGQRNGSIPYSVDPMVSAPFLLTDALGNPTGVSNITAGNMLTVNAETIMNTTQGATFTYQSYDHTTGVNSDITYDATMTNAAIVNDKTKLPSFNFTGPTGGLFTPGNPTSPYLIETNPLFTDLRNFLNSDYMLSRLDYDPEHVQKRLGDGFYEQKLVLDEITQATGRRYLGNYASAEDQYRALMDAGVTYAKDFKLTVGVGLTAAQMAQLTSDMVWLVEKEVQGQKVLAPVVYLSQLHAKDLAPSGALMAARDISLRSANDLTNSGTIKAGYRNQIFASNITNLGGAIDAGGNTELTATKNIVNKSGTISGGNVALTAGQDIKNETATITETVAYANGTATYTRAGKQGVIESRGDLTASAGRDIVISGGQVKAAGDATLDAGRDLTVNSVQTGEKIAVAFSGGGSYQSEKTTNVLSSIQTNGNLSMTAKNDATLSGAQIDTGKDLSLTAGNVSVLAVTDRSLLDAKVGLGRGGSVHQRTVDETSIGTSIVAGGNVSLTATGTAAGQEEGQYFQNDDRMTFGDGRPGNTGVVKNNLIAINDGQLLKKGFLENERTALGVVRIDDGARIGREILVADNDPSNPMHKTTPDRGNVLIQGSSITSKAGTVAISADKDVTIKEAREYHENLTEKKESSSGFLSSKSLETRDLVTTDLAKISSISGANVSIASNKDLNIQGNSITGNDTVTLQAGGNVNITAALDYKHEEHERIETKSNLGAALVGVAAAAFMGVPLTLAPVVGDKLVDSKKSSASSSVTNDQTVIGSSILAGNNITITAGQGTTQNVIPEGSNRESGLLETISPTKTIGDDQRGGNITVKGSSITSQSGGITLVAQNNVSVQEAREQHDSLTNISTVEGGYINSKTNTTRDFVSQDLAVGSSLSGNTITIASKKDLLIQGSSVAGTNDVTLAAGGNVSITTAEETTHTEHETYTKRSGLSFANAGGRVGVSYGSDRLKNTTTTDSVDNVGSTVGSISGGVSITSGKDALIRGSSILSSTGTDITAQNVSIESAYNTMDSLFVSEHRKEGLTLDAGTTLSEAAGKSYDKADKANQAQDSRLKALYAYQAGRSAYDSYADGEKSGLVKDGSINASAGANVGLGYSTSTSKTVTETHTRTAVGSQLISDGNLNIKATGGSDAVDGDITAIGSVLQAKNISLDANRDILLKSAENTYESSTRTSSSSGSIGVKLGAENKDGSGQAGLTITASVAGSRGDNEDYSLTHINTQLNAQENLTIKSGRDTTLKGAQANADKIIADIGRDLNLESEQDVSTYRSRNQNFSASGSYTIGSGNVSGSASYMEAKTDSNYRSVIDQTGLFAGKGGFDIFVGKNTDLKGAVIASTADAAKNKLSTDTLTWSNIENKAEYSSSTIGASISGGSGQKGMFGSGMSAIPIVGVASGDKASNTTHAAIGAGTIEVRSDKNKDLSTLSRDTDNASKALGKIFDQKKIADQQELSKAFGEVAFQLVGDLAKKNEWAEGSAQKVLLHGIVAAVQADLGGGNATVGGLAGMTNEAMLPIIIEQLKKQGIKEDTPEYKSLMQIASTVVGGAVGALASNGSSNGIMTGGAVALSATQNNYLKHQQILDKDKRLAECKDNECRDAVNAEYKKISDEKDAALQHCQGDNSDSCNGLRVEVRAAAAEILVERVVLRKNQNNDAESKATWNTYGSDSYKDDALDTFYQANKTMPDGRGAGFLLSAANAGLFEPMESLGKGIVTFSLANLGYQVEKGKVDAFIGNVGNLLTNLDKVPESMERKIDDFNLQKAKAYLDNDSFALGELDGKVAGTIAGIFVPIAGAKAIKAVDETADVVKLTERIAEASTAVKETEAAAKTAEVVGSSLSNIEAKIAKQMEKRGWTTEGIDSTVNNPSQTVATTDTRWRPDGTKMNDPATAYINKDGSYVVRNNKTGDIVQVSDRTDPNWKSPW